MVVSGGKLYPVIGIWAGQKPVKSVFSMSEKPHTNSAG